MYPFELISQYLPFLRQVFGSDAEILLCDTEKIRYAANPLSERSRPGMPLGDMERSFLQEKIYEDCPYVLNYRALSPSRARLRASTLFLKDDTGSLAGFLTINLDVENLLHTRDLIDTLINGPLSEKNPSAHSKHNNGHSRRVQTELNRYEGVTVAIEDIIHSVIDGYLAKFGVSASRLTRAERQEIVQALDQQGVFLVKGSISEVAQRLNCSDVTIYRYLQQSSR